MENSEATAVQAIQLDATVFPSEVKTIITMVPAGDPYNGAHRYAMVNCLGFEGGQTKYQFERSGESEEVFPKGQMIQFIEKMDDGAVIPGVQSEQLVYVLLDRHKKLNARFPSPQNEKMIAGLEQFIEACRERVQERIDRGVMGELKK